MPVIEREVGRTELYAADEVFLMLNGVPDRARRRGGRPAHRDWHMGPVVEPWRSCTSGPRAAVGTSTRAGAVAVEVAERRRDEILPPFMRRTTRHLARFSPQPTTNQGGRRANYQPRYLAGCPRPPAPVASLRNFQT